MHARRTSPLDEQRALREDVRVPDNKLVGRAVIKDELPSQGVFEEVNRRSGRALGHLQLAAFIHLQAFHIDERAINGCRERGCTNIGSTKQPTLQQTLTCSILLNNNA